MAKKKQFAGKKTKLARLPLTQALTSQAESGPTLPVPPASLSLFTPGTLTWDEISAGGGGPLAAAFLFLVRELAELTFTLQSSPRPGAANPHSYLPDRVPSPAGIREALRQARESLQDLKSRLSHAAPLQVVP